MNNLVLNKHIKDSMRYGEGYTFSKMEAVYNEVMGWPEFSECKKMKRQSFHNLLRIWADMHGGWLGKKGTGADSVFYKVEPPCVLTVIYESFQRIYRARKEKITWAR